MHINFIGRPLIMTVTAEEELLSKCDSVFEQKFFTSFFFAAGAAPFSSFLPPVNLEQSQSSEVESMNWLKVLVKLTIIAWCLWHRDEDSLASYSGSQLGLLEPK